MACVVVEDLNHVALGTPTPAQEGRLLFLLEVNTGKLISDFLLGDLGGGTKSLPWSE